MLARLVIALFALAPFASGADPTILAQRIDIHVDGERPIAGERSRFVVAPNGDIYFTYTLAAGEFECKPLGIIRENGGEIELRAIDSESTWNVDGWGTFGFPFDLAVDYAGELHVASRHRGQPADLTSRTPDKHAPPDRNRWLAGCGYARTDQALLSCSTGRDMLRSPACVHACIALP